MVHADWKPTQPHSQTHAFSLLHSLCFQILQIYRMIFQYNMWKVANLVTLYLYVSSSLIPQTVKQLILHEGDKSIDQ